MICCDFFILFQELSGHLTTEITRLCSLAKQDALQLSQEMDVYELEVRKVTKWILQYVTFSFYYTAWNYSAFCSLTALNVYHLHVFPHGEPQFRFEKKPFHLNLQLN